MPPFNPIRPRRGGPGNPPQPNLPNHGLIGPPGHYQGAPGNSIPRPRGINPNQRKNVLTALNGMSAAKRKQTIARAMYRRKMGFGNGGINQNG